MQFVYSISKKTPRYDLSINGLSICDVGATCVGDLFIILLPIQS